MKQYIGMLLFGLLTLTACNTTTPEQYFDRAVLTSNMLVGFANEGDFRMLRDPSVKADANGNAVPMKSKEMVEDRIKYIEESFGKLKKLKETAETKEMLQTAAAIYELALPVYKTEYTELARLFDEDASKEAIQTQARLIQDKYSAQYEALYNKLINIGKVYAEKHSINVKWNVGA